MYRKPLRTSFATATTVLILTAACADGRAPTAPAQSRLGASALPAADRGAGAVTERPLAEFLAVEQSVHFFYDPNGPMCVAMDYNGAIDRLVQGITGGAVSTGVQVTGTVRERALADGRAEITIKLQAEHAVAIAWPCDESPLLFGLTFDELLAGLPSPVGSVRFTITYIAPAPGLPLKSLEEVYAANEALRIQVHAEVTGPFNAAAGYPAGTQARLFVQGLVLWTPGQLFHAPDQYPGDVSPVETISLRPVNGN